MPDITKPFLLQGHSLTLLPDLPPLSAALLGGLGIVGLHCGCGLNFPPRCLNTDIMHLVTPTGEATQPGRLTLVDADRFYLEHDSVQPLPVADEVFDWVYSEHFIEHISLEQAVVWMKEVRRVLKRGGFLRLSTPDMARYIAGYTDPSGAFFAEHRRRLERAGMKQVPQRPAWMLNQIFRWWGHQWLYDVPEVRVLAQVAGFDPSAVVECSFQQGRLPEVANFDLAWRNDESLYVEITRT
jgi:predicted SAM-dependent methyltransferase